MEQHPIPQNVTSFEFHLIGDMTLKQFSYLATGLGIAYLSFVFLFPLMPFLAVPLIVCSALAGGAFAFIPILDRPLDHWLGAFLRAVYSPTQAGWKVPGEKKKINPSSPAFKNRLQLYLSGTNVNQVIFSQPDLAPSLLTHPSPPPPRLTSSPTPAPLPSKPVSLQPQISEEEKKVPERKAVIPLPSSEELDKLVEVAKQVQLLQARIAEAERQINQFKTTNATPIARIPSSAPQIQQVYNNLQGLVKQTEALYRQTPLVHDKETVHPQKPKIVVVATPKPTPTQLLLTSLPNVINGIITDATGNYLEGVVVIIHNKEGLPVRALKSNKLGQFTGATPLPSGLYTITLEKDGLDFETLQITLNGEAIAPLTIASKKGTLPHGQ